MQSGQENIQNWFDNILEAEQSITLETIIVEEEDADKTKCNQNKQLQHLQIFSTFPLQCVRRFKRA